MTARRCLTVEVFTGRAEKRVRPRNFGSVLSPRSISDGVCGSNLTLVNRKREGVTQISKGAEERERGIRREGCLRLETRLAVCVFDKPTTVLAVEEGCKLVLFLMYRLLSGVFQCLHS